MNLKYARLSEKIWLFIAIITTIIAIYMYFDAKDLSFFIISTLAVIMYFFRRMLRIRFERNNKGQ